MINNPVGVHTAHVSTTDNEIADRISCIKCEADVPTEIELIFQDYPELRSCQRFMPNAELVSHVMGALLRAPCVNLLELSRRILASPGKSII